MSQQLNLVLESLDKAMLQLRTALRDVPYRREGFRSDHLAFVKSVARLRIALSYSRSQLEPRRRRRT